MATAAMLATSRTGLTSLRMNTDTITPTTPTRITSSDSGSGCHGALGRSSAPSPRVRARAGLGRGDAAARPAGRSVVATLVVVSGPAEGSSGARWEGGLRDRLRLELLRLATAVALGSVPGSVALHWHRC